MMNIAEDTEQAQKSTGTATRQPRTLCPSLCEHRKQPKITGSTRDPEISL